MERFENVTLIANPVAQNGAGAAAAQRAYDALRGLYGQDRVSLILTQASGHGVELAREAVAAGTQAVIALGGDGLLHEAVNGLMGVDADKRPVLGLIPLGSGNDYARSIGMPEGVDAAVRALADASSSLVDLGLVNGHYYAETLSFGLDAAIALGTVDQRKISGHTGTRLYMEVGIDQLLHHLDTHTYEAWVEEGQQITYNRGVASKGCAMPASAAGQSITFAVQVGPTYGGGFRICPDAQLDDGLLDVCIAHPPISVPGALNIFLQAKNGKHTKFKNMEFFRCTGITVRFAHLVPTQMDGEPLVADEYRVSVVPRALRVLQNKKEK